MNEPPNLISTAIKNLRDTIIDEVEPLLDECIFPIDDLVADDKVNVVEAELEYVMFALQHAHGDIHMIDDIKKMKPTDKPTDILISTISYLNTHVAFEQIQELCGVFRHVMLIKPTLTSPIDETIYVACTNDETVSISKQMPTPAASYNMSGIIDFMYCCYHYALCVVKACNSLDEDPTNIIYTQYLKQLLAMLKACDIPIAS